MATRLRLGMRAVMNFPHPIAAAGAGWGPERQLDATDQVLEASLGGVSVGKPPRVYERCRMAMASSVPPNNACFF